MKFKLLFCFLILSFSLSAGDFRGGDIHVEQYTASSVQVNININLLIHSEIDEITICWGDGSCEVLGNPQILEYPAIDSKTLLFFWIHQYSQFGFYDITVEECCWANDIFNMTLIGDQDFLLETSFKLINPQNGAFNVMPYSQTLPVNIGNVGQYLAYNSLVNIPANDESTFEICEVDVVNYYTLDEIFMQPNNFYLDPQTGGFTWFNPPAQGFFIIKICISTTRQGELISETSRDIFVAIDQALGLEAFKNDDFDLKYYPNPVNDFLHFEYSLNENSTVEITLFDVLGKQIKTLLSSERNEGKNEEIFKIEDLPQSAYFLKIIIEDQFGTIPIVKN